MIEMPATTTLTLLDRLRLCLPGKCLLCGFPVRGVISLCRPCELLLPRNRQHCAICGVAVGTAGWTDRCGRCLLSPPPFTQCRGVFHYRQPVTKLLTDFKFHGNFASGRALGLQLARAFSDHYAAAQALSGVRQLPRVLIPVPLHSRRLRQRGFNQSALLCKMVAERTSVPVATRLLARSRHTEPQTRLSARQRSRNLHQAFSVTQQLTDPDLRHVAIIDDVVTSTATVRAASQVLLAAGAWRIDVWAVARA
jgi:ComF family protein